jgi:DNA-binding response OmpR family regulator
VSSHFEVLINIKQIMGKSTLLVIEGQHADHPAFAADLRKKGFEVTLVSNGGKAISCLDDGMKPDVIVVNAATLRTSGKRICQSLREKATKLPILLIPDPDRDVEITVADVSLSLPFTVQKLSNRVRHLIPSDGKNSIHVGPIRLDVEKRMVRCAGKQSRLTPRLIRLLQILMDHRGEAVERKSLFSKVWETNYTDDTRTLDVHISWLRHAIEEDPDHPKYLKTVRGVGYRLDV